MADRRVSRLLPSPGSPWLIGLMVLLVVVAAVWLAPERVPEPPLDLVALGPDGGFRDTLVVPQDWRDTTVSPTGELRVPLVLGVRNTGERAGRPERLSLSVPFQYRLVDPNGRLRAELQPGSPLITYSLETGLGPVEPGRLPSLLPALDTLWLDVVIPTHHCVTLPDSVPELIPAPPPSPAALREVRVFYSLEGGSLSSRRTGTLTIRLDTALLEIEASDPPPAFPVVTDTALASPSVGPLRRAGVRTAECGDRAALTLRSTLWLTAGGGRVITLELGREVRKWLYDLDADGVIERESWDADRDGIVETTRRTRLPTPEFLLPIQPEIGPSVDSVPAGPA